MMERVSIVPSVVFSFVNCFVKNDAIIHKINPTRIQSSKEFLHIHELTHRRELMEER